MSHNTPSTAQRPEPTRTHGLASRSAAEARALRANRTHRMFGAVMTVLAIGGFALMWYAWNIPAHPCLATDTSPLDGTMQACHNLDDGVLGRQIIYMVAGFCAALFALRSIWRGLGVIK